MQAAGISYPGNAIDLRDSIGSRALIEAAGNNNSTFEMFFARYGDSEWRSIYSKSDYIFDWGMDYRFDSSGNIVPATASGRGFSVLNLSCYMNDTTIGTGAKDAPWFQRFTQVIFSRQPIPIPGAEA